MGKTTVLIVDDEPDIIATLQFRLASAGYEVLTAEDGARALDVIRANAVDLVLADFMMPEINGLELTRLVKAEPKWAQIKILLFSCNAEPEFRQRALELGAVDYLSKGDGAQSIASRVYELVSPEKETAQPLPVARESADETALQSQLLTLARHLDDVLKMARVERDLPQSTQVALDVASRIMQDIQRLAGSSSEAARGNPAESAASYPPRPSAETNPPERTQATPVPSEGTL